MTTRSRGLACADPVARNIAQGDLRIGDARGVLRRSKRIQFRAEAKVRVEQLIGCRILEAAERLQHLARHAAEHVLHAAIMIRILTSEVHSARSSLDDRMSFECQFQCTRPYLPDSVLGF